jgi:hypothetical protein
MKAFPFCYAIIQATPSALAPAYTLSSSEFCLQLLSPAPVFRLTAKKQLNGKQEERACCSWISLIGIKAIRSIQKDIHFLNPIFLFSEMYIPVRKIGERPCSFPS